MENRALILLMRSAEDPEVTDLTAIDAILDKPVQKEALQTILKERLEGPSGKASAALKPPPFDFISLTIFFFPFLFFFLFLSFTAE